MLQHNIDGRHLIERVRFFKSDQQHQEATAF